MIIVQADLQTSAQRLPLGGSNLVNKLDPNESVDQVLHHEVKELGTHMFVLSSWSCHNNIILLIDCRLICGVHYTTAQGEKLYFRKFFKFQVSHGNNQLNVNRDSCCCRF